jgi:CRP-like cAMP-binding protein
MALLPHLSFVTFQKDSYIMVEGRPNGGKFFIIHRGRVHISKQIEVVAERGGSILGPGDFFGVVEAMSGHSHIETARALTEVTLISVQRDQYTQLIQQNTPVAMKIIREFSKRMRYLDEALTRLTLKNTASDDPAHLFPVGEYYALQSQYAQAYYAYSKYIKYCPQGEHIQAARERMMKIAPYVPSLKMDFVEGELSRLYPKNHMIFSEGEPGDELYILQKGAVKIVKIVDNKEVLLAVLKPGDIFGEMALLEAKPRTACAVAYADCVVLAVNRDNFELMVASQSQMITRLTMLLADRIWFIYKQLVNTLFPDPLGRIYDSLLLQLEKNRVPIDVHQAYIFDFGPTELLNMVGLSRQDGAPALRKLLENRNIQVLQDKLYAADVVEIARQTDYYRKALKRGLSMKAPAPRRSV